MKSLVLFISVVFLFLSACSITYNSQELTKSAKSHFPYIKEVSKYGMTAECTAKNPIVSISKKNNNISLKIDIYVKTWLKDFDGKVKISGTPVFKSDTIFYSKINIDKFDISGLPEWIDNWVGKKISAYIEDTPIVNLTGFKAWLVEDVYIDEGDILRVELSIW